VTPGLCVQTQMTAFTKILAGTLALASLLITPTSSAALIFGLPSPHSLPPQVPSVRVEWPGAEARGETVGAVHYSYAGSTIPEVDDRCASGFSAGFTSPPGTTFTIPSRHRGTNVVGSRITTELDATGGVPCVLISHDGAMMHRGLPGEWSTPGTFGPGTYDIRIGAPGSYHFTVDVELVAR
jgi:hypothetical protein